METNENEDKNEKKKRPLKVQQQIQSSSVRVSVKLLLDWETFGSVDEERIVWLESVFGRHRI